MGSPTSELTVKILDQTGVELLVEPFANPNDVTGEFAWLTHPFAASVALDPGFYYIVLANTAMSRRDPTDYYFLQEAEASYVEVTRRFVYTTDLTALAYGSPGDTTCGLLRTTRMSFD